MIIRDKPEISSQDMAPTALVVQCFVKLDTLQNLCESLTRCRGIDKVALIFWCDSPVGSRSEERYARLSGEVRAYLERFSETNSSKFVSIEIRVNDTNRGTCKTCQLAMDYAFEKFPFAIFVEDDVLFSEDAFLWFDVIRQQRLLEMERYWAVAGESIFFDAQDRPIPEGWKEKMMDVCVRNQLLSAFVSHSFVPSTCFATTREKWSEFGFTRGQPLGDEDLCRRCSEEGRQCVFPVVPRVKDVGMLHDDGYSVLIHTKAGVKEIKNTYLLAEDLLRLGFSPPLNFSEMTEGDGELYSQSSKLLPL